MTLRKISATEPSFKAMLAALRAADLPVTDLHEGAARYYMLGEGEAFGGIALFGTVALLRSLVVPSTRGSGIGSALLTELLAKARAEGVAEVWLLTTTAKGFFAKHGFLPADRTEAPDAIAVTSQFRDLCPASATLMRLALT